MRGIVQRVLSASVTVDDAVISKINRGVLVLVGLTDGDNVKDAEFLCKKILATRLWPDDSDKPWAKNVSDIGGDILLVSQFTLYAQLKKPRPDFHHAMAPDRARTAYADFVALMRSKYAADRVHDGVFGAMMEVALVNDGPVTLILDSNEKAAGAPAVDASASAVASASASASDPADA